MCMLLHGDAALLVRPRSGSLDLSNLFGYKTGGTIHIIINNQIGFTTAPKNSRIPLFIGVAKVVDAPIFHVNTGDNRSHWSRAFRSQIEYRHRFKKDVVIDMIVGATAIMR